MESVKGVLISQADKRPKSAQGNSLELQSTTPGEHAANRGVERHHGEPFNNGPLPIGFDPPDCLSAAYPSRPNPEHAKSLPD